MPRRDKLAHDLPNQIDADEYDVGPNPLDTAGLAETETQSRQERRCQERRQRRGNDSSEEVRNDAGGGHLPLHVENDIANLGMLLSLIQPQDIGRAHKFGPTLEEYAVQGVPADCGEDWSRATIEAAITCVPHQLALTPEAL